MRYFFLVAAYILFLMAAGIFSRSVGILEDHFWSISANIKSDDLENPVFDPRKNIWYLPCCYEKTSPGYGILFSLFGYRSVATIGTILSYISFWILIISVLVLKNFLTNSSKNNVNIPKTNGDSDGLVYQKLIV